MTTALPAADAHNPGIRRATMVGNCIAAMAAVELLHLKRNPPAAYQGKYDPRVLFHTFKALHDSGNM